VRASTLGGTIEGLRTSTEETDMKATGYMVEAEWDGQTLTARGTNKMGQAALRGIEKDEGDVVLPREQIADVELKEASRLANGNLIVRTVDGKKYQLHFRRKQAEDFAALADALA
jgi:hypothetical protein